MATAANAIRSPHSQGDRRRYPIRLLAATSALLLVCLASSASAFAAPPANDDLAAATVVPGLPFSDTVDMTDATNESDETGSYLVRRSGYGPLSIYTGSSVANAAQVSCGSDQTVFHAEAGTTYHLQVGAVGGYGLQGQLSVEHAPDARASFYYWPSDPSILDTVSFYDYSYDIAGIGSRRWRLSDGFTTTDAGFGHRFAADGSYAAKLDVTTTDGRTASSSQTVAVKTHDVAIASMTVPAQGRVGKTKQVAIGVNNSRYAETVRVSILRSVPGGGFEEVGQVTQGVPARAVRRTTNFEISYTFSEQDAAFGKVTFQAVATTLTARDANPSDNTVIAPATKVKP